MHAPDPRLQYRRMSHGACMGLLSRTRSGRCVLAQRRCMHAQVMCGHEYTVKNLEFAAAAGGCWPCPENHRLQRASMA